MLMTFDVMKGENRSIPGWQLRNSLVEGYAVDHRHGIRILGAFYDLHRRLAVFGGLFHPHSAFAKMHQDLIYRQSMEPGGKGGLATKTADFSKELYEDLLCQVFSLRDVAGHPQTKGIDPAIVPLVELLEGPHVALSGALSQSVIRCFLCLGFGCGHVSVYSGKRLRSPGS